MLTKEEILKSAAFQLLQQGMKDHSAYWVCYVLSHSVTAWALFEQWARETLELDK